MSTPRVRADELSSDDLIAAATTYPSKLAVLRTQRFRSLAGFSSWFGQRYLLVKTYGQDKDIKESIAGYFEDPWGTSSEYSAPRFQLPSEVSGDAPGKAVPGHRPARTCRPGARCGPARACRR